MPKKIYIDINETDKPGNHDFDECSSIEFLDETSESENSSIGKEEPGVEIALWSKKHRISKTALKELLQILNEHAPELNLPASGRCLKKTLKKSAVESKNESSAHFKFIDIALVGVKKRIRKTKIIERPFETSEEFKEFDKKLTNDKDLQEQLAEELIYKLGPDPHESVDEIWKKTLTDKAAENFVWRGRRDISKEGIKGYKFSEIFMLSFLSKFSYPPDVFGRLCKKYFNYSHDRLRKNRYRLKKIG